MVGGVVGFSARWVVLPSHALVLFVHGGLCSFGVGRWAVVVVASGVVFGVVVVVVVVVVVGAWGVGGGGGGVRGVGGCVAVGMPLGSPGAPVGRGGRASFVALGAARLGR